MSGGGENRIRAFLIFLIYNLKLKFENILNILVTLYSYSFPPLFSMLYKHWKELTLIVWYYKLQYFNTQHKNLHHKVYMTTFLCSNSQFFRHFWNTLSIRCIQCCYPSSVERRHPCFAKQCHYDDADEKITWKTLNASRKVCSQNLRPAKY